jgi:hypothetical protein
MESNLMELIVPSRHARDAIIELEKQFLGHKQHFRGIFFLKLLGSTKRLWLLLLLSSYQLNYFVGKMPTVSQKQWY